MADAAGDPHRRRRISARTSAVARIDQLARMLRSTADSNGTLDTLRAERAAARRHRARNREKALAVRQLKPLRHFIQKKNQLS